MQYTYIHGDMNLLMTKITIAATTVVLLFSPALLPPHHSLPTTFILTDSRV